MPIALAPLEKSNLRDVGAKATLSVGKVTLAGLSIVNNQAAVIFVQLFDALLANVTLGTTVPDYEFSVAASTSVVVPIATNGVLFRTGIVVGSTTTEKGATPSAAGVIIYFLTQ